MKKIKRKKYFLNKELQAKYLVLSIACLLAYTLILLGAIFAPYILPMYSSAPFAEKAAAAETMLMLHTKAWPGIGLVVLLFGLGTVLLTHKIAGPIYVFQTIIKEWIRGNLAARVRLRAGDDLQEMKDDFNCFAEKMEGLIRDLDGEHQKLYRYISQLEDALKVVDTVPNSVPDPDALGVDKENIKRLLSNYTFGKPPASPLPSAS